VPQGEGRPNREAFGRSTGLSEWPAEYTTLLFRMFGIYGVAFSLLAIAIAAKIFSRGERWAWCALLIGNTIAFGAPMMYDQIVRAVGPFELSEYLGLGDLRVPRRHRSFPRRLVS
jgi:hypothetical protein